MSENLYPEASVLDADEIVSIQFLSEDGNTVKTVIQMEYPYYDVHALYRGVEYADCFNDREPFDRMTHIFRLPPPDTNGDCELLLFFSDDETDGEIFCHKMRYENIPYADIEQLRKQNDSQIVIRSQTSQEIAEGLRYIRLHCTDSANAPVEIFVLDADMEQVSLYVGTPDDGYAAHGCRAKIPDMIAAAERSGVRVLASVNGDFFDMFGDGSPSGLCVKNGQVIANATSTRPFIGQLKNGSAIIADLKENPSLYKELQYAVAGLQWILKDGEPYEWAPLEPFAYTRHPRTCVGIRPDGHVILLEADGRIPAYSNGATLLDLANLLKGFGCVSGINIDGGGSSAVYTKINGEWILQSNPADLVRPNDKLIREEYNCIMLAAK